MCDTDPQDIGIPPVEPAETLKGDAKGQRMAGIVKDFLAQCRKILAGEEKANGLILRGLAHKPSLPPMGSLYHLKCAAVAVYPMYRGLARIVGMDILDTGETVADEIRTIADNYGKYTYFFMHVKGMDSSGEDGNFDKRVTVIEELDAALPALLDLKPDVLAVTGDHSTPALLKSHSWHPVPLMIHSPYTRHSHAAGFSESECAHGDLGRISAVHVLPIMLGNALRLKKFGA